MTKYKMRRIYITLAAVMMAGMMTACSASDAGSTGGTAVERAASETEKDVTSDNETIQKEENAEAESNDESLGSEEAVQDSDESEHFTERDLKQTADTEGAEKINLTSGQDISITSEGVYVVSGSAENVTITVEAGDEDKVQIVLDGVNVNNTEAPFIYVKNADKVFVTTADGENTLEVTGEYKADGDKELDAVIFSKDDLVLNGTGVLYINSSDNAVSCKDTLKITGGTLNISCSGNAFEAHDAIKIADGTIKITECNDGLHAKDSDDDSIGAVYIRGGAFDITASDDAIHATTTIDIDGGEFTLDARECIEGTYIKINDGSFVIKASDDGINAAAKSDEYTPTFEMNGGEVTITMGAGDTDGVDSNGNIYINGGTISITGQSSFDYDGEAVYNGGTVIENGKETNTISNQFFGQGGDFKQGGGHPDGNFPTDGTQPDENFQPDGNFPTDGAQPDGNFQPDGNGTQPGGNMTPGQNRRQRPGQMQEQNQEQNQEQEDDTI